MLAADQALFAGNVAPRAHMSAAAAATAGAAESDSDDACSSVGSECGAALVNPDVQRDRRQGRREEAQHAAAPPCEPAFITRPLDEHAPAPAPAAHSAAVQREYTPQPGTSAGEPVATHASAAAANADAAPDDADAQEQGAWFGDTPAAVARAAAAIDSIDADIVIENQVYVASVEAAQELRDDAPLADITVGTVSDTLRASALRRVLNDQAQDMSGWLCEDGVSYATLALQVGPCVQIAFDPEVVHAPHRMSRSAMQVFAYLNILCCAGYSKRWWPRPHRFCKLTAGGVLVP